MAESRILGPLYDVEIEGYTTVPRWENELKVWGEVEPYES
jgi:hypothetical protein